MYAPARSVEVSTSSRESSTSPIVIDRVPMIGNGL